MRNARKNEISKSFRVEKPTVSNFRWSFLSNVLMSFSSGKYGTNTAQSFAGSSASATTLACASLLAKVSQKALPPPLPWLAHLCSRLSAHLPWLAPSCEKASPQPRQQVRERMKQLAVTTGHRNGECHFRSLHRSAQHS